MAQSRYLAALDAEQRAKLEQCQHVARLARRAHHGIGFRGHRGLGFRRSIDEIAGLDGVRQKHLNFLCVVAVGNRLDRSPASWRFRH